MEVTYDNLDIIIDTTPKNLIAILDGLVPVNGSLNEFFNTSTHKMNVYNDDSSIFMKFNVIGTWNPVMASPNTMRIAFGNSVGNVASSSKTSGMDADVLQFVTYMSIDKDGLIATAGTEPLISVLETDFTLTRLFITVEQVTAVESITPV